MFVVVRKSSVRLVLERVARRALRSGEAVVVGCWAAAGAFEEDGREAVFALANLAAAAVAAADTVIGDDEGRVIGDALGSLLFLASIEGADVRFRCCTAGA